MQISWYNEHIVYIAKKIIKYLTRRNVMEIYVKPEIDVVSTAAADVISSSITYDENEVYEDKFFSV